MFSGKPKIYVKFYGTEYDGVSIWDEKLNISEDIFGFREEKKNVKADEFIAKAGYLSEILSKNMNFVRVDWMIYKNKLYFLELTFTPYSGFHKFINKKNELILGNFI